MKIDLNCDLGESFGAYRLGNDEAILPWITSANIACGFHAGDPLVMDITVRMAHSLGVSLGAHPGYPDLQGFGRRMMDLTPDEVEAYILYQVGALAGFARSMGVELVHVKPHGALYNQAAKDHALAAAVAAGTARFSRSLVLVGLAGSQLLAAGQEAGLRVAGEGFADRAYNPDGSLRSRRLPGALLETPEQALAQAIRLARDGVVVSSGSQTERWPVETICIHGDTPGAPVFVQSLRSSLPGAGIEVGPLGLG
jgi:5-oxoprolinase (ATP-hydrolysing) subunit A